MNEIDGPVVVRNARVRVRPGRGRARRCHGQGTHVLTRSVEGRSGTVSADPRESQALVREVGGKRRDPKRAKAFTKNPKYVGSARRPSAPVGYHESRTIKTPARAAKDREGWL